jgi:hypothetical protein
MRNSISYEWDYETVDEFGDILDHNHADKLSQFTDQDKTDSLVLVRDEGNENEGVVNRSWAYVKEGKLPEYFKDAAGCEVSKVPKRFHLELKSYRNNVI